MLLDYITCLLRMQGADSMYAVIYQLLEFTHFTMISSEYGIAQVIDISHGDIFRVHEKPRVITSDWSSRFHSACW
jgi:hypothetical protein